MACLQVLKIVSCECNYKSYLLFSTFSKSKVAFNIQGTDAFNQQCLKFSTTTSRRNKWRLTMGLEPNPNVYGPLRNLPDYSFIDGRSVPLSKTKKVRLELQKKFCNKITELSNEIDVGLQQYNEKLRNNDLKKQEEWKNRLKPKGKLLLKTKSRSFE